jgi:hypothetical protein
VTNLALQSESFASPWVPANVTIPAYVGAMPTMARAPTSGVVVSDDNNYGTHGVFLPPAGVVWGRLIFSIFAKAVAGSGWFSPSGIRAGGYSYFDLVNGALGTVPTSLLTPYMEAAGNGWYRLALATTDAVVQTGLQQSLVLGNGGGAYQGVSGQRIALAGAMLEVAQPGQTTPSPYVVSGATAGVGRRETRQNYYRFSDDLTKSEHIKNTGIVIVSGSLDVPAPSDVPTAAVQKWTYDGSGVAGDYRLYSNAGAIELLYRKGVPYAWAMWMRVASGTLPLRVQLCINVQAITVTSTWQRFLILATGNGSLGIQPTVFSAAANNAAFTLYTAGAQLVQGNNMPDYIATLGAPANANGAPRSIVS